MKRIPSASVALALFLSAAAALLPLVRSGTVRSGPPGSTRRPYYRIRADIDYELLTFKGTASVTITTDESEPLNDVVFFLHANAKGIVGDERRKNIIVDGVSLNKSAAPFALRGSVLHVSLPEAKTPPFTLNISYHGVVPRGTPDSGGGLAQLLGASGAALGGSLGRQTSAGSGDYGLYTYANGILSLGSFWYPQLAVRELGRWRDEEPGGFGDISFAESGDFDVALNVPATVVIASTGQGESTESARLSQSHLHRYTGRNVRDFAVLMSEDYVVRSRSFEIEGRPVSVEAYALPKNQDRLDNAIEVAGQALRIYSQRFGPYPYRTLKVVEGPIRGGAGGMEFSGLISIASLVYGDWEKEITGLAGSVPIEGLGKLLSALGSRPGAEQPGKSEGSQPAPADPLATLFKSVLGQQGDLLGSMFEMTVAHEVAHQWWAMSVGSDSVRTPFLDESLANYSAVVYFEDRYGKPRADQMMGLHLKMPYTASRMFGLQDAPANLPTSAYAGNLQYAAIVYGKGALYYDALRRAVGDTAFFGALRDYYNKYSGRIAPSNALLAVMRSKASGAGVDALYRHWIEEKHGDEDIAGGNVMGIGELLKAILSGRGIPQPKSSVTPPPE